MITRPGRAVSPTSTGAPPPSSRSDRRRRRRRTSTWRSDARPISPATRPRRPPSMRRSETARARRRLRARSRPGAIWTRSGRTRPSGARSPETCCATAGERLKRILFVAEAVTLAQVVRLVTLARALDPARYEIHFASARFDDLIFRDPRFVRHPIWSLSPAVIETRVARGQRLYGRRTLAAYAREEWAL